jgi:HNH endonuclease
VSFISKLKYVNDINYRSGVNDSLETIKKIFDSFKECEPDFSEYIHEEYLKTLLSYKVDIEEFRHSQHQYFEWSTWSYEKGFIKFFKIIKEKLFSLRKQVHSFIPGFTSQNSEGISSQLRYRIFQRDCFRCVICGESPSFNPIIVLHCDHIHPRAKGGTASFHNLRTLCNICNLGKSDSV